MVLTTIIVFIIVLGLLVFVHELGHFVASRIFGVGVEEFGFGYPPRIFGIKKGKTLYSLNWIPIGGFCKIKGVIGGDQAADAKKKENFEGDDTFISKPVWQRFIILAAGVFMNIVLCIFVLSIGYIIGLPESTVDLGARAKVTNQEIIVSMVEPNTPAATAEIQAGDAIKTIDDQSFTSVLALNDYNKTKGDQEINLTLLRNNEEINTSLTLQKLEQTGDIGMGVLLSETGTVQYPWYLAFWQGTKKTFLLLVYILQALAVIIQQLFSSGTVDGDVAGPVGIVVLTNQVTQMGFIYILQFTALLSLNLAIFNFLPFPALDGGRVIFLIIEKIRRKPVSEKIEGLVHNLGFAFLILLIILVTFRDVGKYNLLNYFSNLF